MVLNQPIQPKGDLQSLWQIFINLINNYTSITQRNHLVRIDIFQLLRTASSMKRSALNKIKVSSFPGHSWQSPWTLRTPSLKHFSSKCNPLFLWMAILTMKLLKMEYKNGSVLETYRKINQLGAVYFFKLTFQQIGF